MQGSGMSSLYIKSTWSQARGTRPSRLHKVRQTSSLPRSLLGLFGNFRSLSSVRSRAAPLQCAASILVENPRGARPSAERKGPWVKRELSLGSPTLNSSQQHHQQIGESSLSPGKFHVPPFASVMSPLWGWGQLHGACNRCGLVPMCNFTFICKRHERSVWMRGILSSRAAPRFGRPPRAATRSMQSVRIGDDERYAVAFARSNGQ